MERGEGGLHTKCGTYKRAGGGEEKGSWGRV